MTWQVLEADCVEAMKEMDEASVDAICTDPPYGLEFMGREWDKLAGDWRTDLGRGEHAAATGRPSGKRGFDGHPPTPRFHAGKTAQEWHQAWATEALRVLKPGGHLLAFGGTRTYHRLACAIEDAGFEIRDSVIWLYGSGFPKSLDVSKAIDRAAGAEREVVGTNPNHREAPEVEARWNNAVLSPDLTAPATPEAQRWQGWGTAMKPAHEPIVVARKPLTGTVAQNVERFGTGALAIDRCRIGSDQITVNGYRSEDDPELHAQRASTMFRAGVEREPTQHTGRWPANVALSHLPECERVGERRVKGSVNHHVSQTSIGDGKTYQGGAERTGHDYVDEDGLETVEAWSCAPGCPVAELDRQSGERPTGGRGSRGLGIGDGYGGSDAEWDEPRGYDDSAAGASRFFYVAKSSRSERNAGLEGFEAQHRPNGNKWTDRDYRVERGERTPGRESGPRQNVHPTVKPVDLMRWLVRLVTPPDGLVLDPFAGSGTTGIACVLEDFDFIGIEREPDYVEIAKARIDYWAKQPKQLDLLGDAA